MALLIALDAGVVGLLCSSPLLPDVAACKAWATGHAARGASILIPDVTDFEVRRELVRLGASAKLRRLDQLRAIFRAVDVSTAAWARAAGFWADVRRSGRPTADPKALDADSILAGVAATIGGPGDSVIIATTNVGHLRRFPGVLADEWRSIP